ncbi:Dihydrolipoamide acetyltransferase (Partial), partial [Ectocarpus siliculosus]
MHSVPAHGAQGRGAFWVAARDARKESRHTGGVEGISSRGAGAPRPRNLVAVSRRHFSSGLPDHDVVGLPALSPTMETGTITEWLVKEGDAFAAGDIICMVETDKATVDFEAQDEAVLAKILVPAGTPDVAVGTPMMVLTESTDDVAAFKDFSAGAPETETAAPVAAPAAEVVVAEEPAPAAPAAPEAAAPAPGGRVAASPLAKHVSFRGRGGGGGGGDS